MLQNTPADFVSVSCLSCAASIVCLGWGGVGEGVGYLVVELRYML